MEIYEYSVERPDGTTQPLSAYEGKVLLIVNTATGCGFTPQYRELEEFYRKYHDKGLEILDIPCNQFAGQTPGTDEEIHEFCTLKYHTAVSYTHLRSQKGFAGFGKGAKAAAMGIMLRKIDKNYKENPDIKWNFTKFLVDRQGTVVVRFEPTGDMNELERQILALL